MRFWKTLLGCSILAALALLGWTAHSGWGRPLIRSVEARQEAAATPSKPAQPSAAEDPVNVQEIVAFAQKGLDWLARAQHPDGGWGAGSHAAQQMRDPHQVKTDPATTAFVGLALLRAGSTPVAGRHREALRRATHYLVDAVERSPATDPFITDLRSTQLQSKLGPYIDTSMAAQYLARATMALPPEDALSVPVDQALDKCLRKLTSVQSQDGSWNQGGGWAPVLQSSQSLNALELAQVSGKKIDQAVLQRARQAQKGNYSLETGRASAGSGAGVELYAYSSAQKAAAAEYRIATDTIQKAKERGVLNEDATVSEENLARAGLTTRSGRNVMAGYLALTSMDARLDDDNLLRGFGSNGGEEFLSYLLTSESLVISGSGKWKDWNQKMHQRLAKIQNPDGSWSGHHCITSPVFCTAAVLQCLMADRDAKVLLAVANVAVE